MPGEEGALRALLLAQRYDEAAALVMDSPALATSYPVTDLARLLLSVGELPLLLKWLRRGSATRPLLLRDAQLLEGLVTGLVDKGDLAAAAKAAVDVLEGFVRRGSGVQGWTPHRLVRLMADRGEFALAHRYARELRQPDAVPAQEMLDGLMAERQWVLAFNVARGARLGAGGVLERLVVGMCADSNWEVAVRSVEVAGLEATFTPERLVRLMLQAGDMLAATTYMAKFKLDDATLRAEVVASMIRAGQAHAALKYTLKWGLQETYPPEKLVVRMLKLNQLHHATAWIARLGLQERFAHLMPRVREAQSAMRAEFQARHAALARSAQARRAAAGLPPWNYDSDSDGEAEVVSREEEVVVVGAAPPAAAGGGGGVPTPAVPPQPMGAWGQPRPPQQAWGAAYAAPAAPGGYAAPAGGYAAPAGGYAATAAAPGAPAPGGYAAAAAAAAPRGYPPAGPAGAFYGGQVPQPTYQAPPAPRW